MRIAVPAEVNTGAPFTLAEVVVDIGLLTIPFVYVYIVLEGEEALRADISGYLPC